MTTTTTTYPVSGMTCGHCVAAVTQALEALPDVERATVDLDTSSATVTSTAPLDLAAVRAAVADAGYQVDE